MRYIHAFTSAIFGARHDWFTTKVWIEHSVPFDSKALHPIVGLVLQLAFAAVFRSSVSKPLPWLLVLALELANEWTDLTVEVWPDRALQIRGSISDVVLTMILPTLLLLACRYSPGIFRRR